MEVTCEPRLHEFRTDRLVLRTPGMWDWRVMAATASDPDAQRFLNWPRAQIVPPRKLDKALQGRQGGPRARVRPPETALAILLDGQVIGGAGLRRPERADQLEIGNYLSPLHRGRGLGTEAIAGITSFAHHHLGVPRVIAGMHAENLASQGQFRACGYRRTDGPSTYLLPNGLEVQPVWWMHEDPLSTVLCNQY